MPASPDPAGLGPRPQVPPLSVCLDSISKSAQLTASSLSCHGSTDTTKCSLSRVQEHTTARDRSLGPQSTSDGAGHTACHLVDIFSCFPDDENQQSSTCLFADWLARQAPFSMSSFNHQGRGTGVLILEAQERLSDPASEEQSED